MTVHRHAAVGVVDISRRQIQHIDIGHASGAIDDAIGLGGMFGAFMREDHAQAIVRGLDPFHADAGLDTNSDALALGLDTCDGVGIHRGQQLRQRFEDDDVGAGARINVAKFQRYDAAAHEDHRTRQAPLAQHFVRRDHVLGARDGQWAWLRSGRDHDVPGLEVTLANADRIGPSENRVALDHLDIAMRHRAGEIRRDILDQVLLAVDQRGPVELRLADRDVVNGGALDFVQGMTGRDQYLLRRAATVRTGSVEVVRFDYRDRHSSASDRAGDANAGVAAAQDHHVECLYTHRRFSYVAVDPRDAARSGRVIGVARSNYARCAGVVTGQ